MNAINIYGQSHGAHLYLCAKLMRLDCALIESETSDTSAWKQEYEYSLDKLASFTKTYFDFALWKWYLDNEMVVGTSIPGGVDIYVEDGITLDKTVKNFLKSLHDNNIVLNLHHFLETSVWNREVISSTINMIQNRLPNADEIEYWNEETGRNLEFKIDYFSFCLILTFDTIGRGLGLHCSYVNTFKTIKYGLNLLYPKVAVIMSGHTRHFEDFSDSHKIFIDNPYMDIFIHTWSKRGPRKVYRENENVNTVALNEKYKPCKLVIEDLDHNRPEFSLKDGLYNQDTLFFKHEQEKDDASFYVNANLYSFYKTSLLIKEFEDENNFHYDGLLKIPFCFDITQFVWSSIARNISLGDNVVWTSKGCNRCTIEYTWPYLYHPKRHDDHYNDIGVQWMYGRREVMMNACELYLHAIAISADVLEENITNHVHVKAIRKFHQFVYMLGIDDIEKRIYDIDLVPMRIEAFYLENLFRHWFKENMIVTSKFPDIDGKFSKFDKDRNLVW